MSPRSPAKLFRILACVCLIAAVALVSACRDRGCDDVYTKEQSPDGRFEVVVCRHGGGTAMPGQGGDAPGTIRLREIATGRVLHEVPIEMVQQFPGVEWTDGHARIKLFAEWLLPGGLGNP